MYISCSVLQDVREVLEQVARLRLASGWEFALPPDADFLTRHQAPVCLCSCPHLGRVCTNRSSSDLGFTRLLSHMMIMFLSGSSTIVRVLGRPLTIII